MLKNLNFSFFWENNSIFGKNPKGAPKKMVPWEHQLNVHEAFKTA